MEFFKNLSVKYKIILIMMVACVITLIVSCVTFAAYNILSIRKFMVNETSTLADFIATNSTDAIILNDREIGEKVLSTLEAKKQVEFASIHNNDGELIALYRRKGRFKRFEPPNVNFYGSEFNDDSLILRKRILLENENIGTLFIISNIEEINKSIERYFFIVLIIMFFLIFVAYLLSLELQYFISRPIMSLAKVAKRVSEKKEYSLRAMRYANDEVGFLIDQFNEMLDQIQAKEESLKEINVNLDNLVKDRTKKLLNEVEVRKKAEKIAQDSLKEKDMLLKEIHHRVKNNLQIISSILNLQSDGITDKDAINLFSDSQDRINSMALIHERLYRSSEFEYVDFSTYLTDLINYLISSHHAESSKIEVKTDIEKVNLNIETAVPCGLIINELILNSIKHAFPNNNSGYIKIELKKISGENKYKLSISDNGIGINNEMDIANSSTLGLQLVYNLVQQLDGKIDVNNTNGTRFDIYFNELIYKKRH